MRFVVTAIFASVLLLGLVSALEPSQYSDPSIYGNYKPAKTSITFNNNTGSVNNSFYWQGYTPDSYNATYLAGRFAASLSYTNTVVNGNTTAIIAGILANSTADRVYANTILQGNLSANVSAVLLNATQTYVPYVGANRNVNLTGYNITIGNSLQFNNTNSSGRGSVSFGSIASGEINQTIQATGQGSLAGGVITGGLNNGILSSAIGTVALGTVGSTGSVIRSIQSGSFTLGAMQGNGDNILTASGTGSAALARSAGSNNTFTASGAGSFIHGQMNNGQRNSVSASGASSFLQFGIEGGSGNANNSFSAAGTGSSLFGSLSTPNVPSINNSILSGAPGTIVFGSIGSGLIAAMSNNTIRATGGGSVLIGHIPSGRDNNFILAGGIGAVGIGMSNMTCDGFAAICFGQNVNVSANNSMAIGLGSNLLQSIGQERVLAIMTGNVGINTTTPTAALHVNGTMRVEQNVTLNSLLTLRAINIPACDASTNGSIARNLSGFYGCAIGDGNWVRFGA